MPFFPCVLASPILTIEAAISLPITFPLGPIQFLACRASAPVPHPISIKAQFEGGLRSSRSRMALRSKMPIRSLAYSLATSSHPCRISPLILIALSLEFKEILVACRLCAMQSLLYPGTGISRCLSKAKMLKA